MAAALALLLSLGGTAVSFARGESDEFPSKVLQARLFCEGTNWPEPTEMLMAPLLVANRAEFDGKTVLDIGTGSGILALYAAKMGATKVVATDIAPSAITCTELNARRLGFESVIETRLVRLEDPSAYSVVRPDEVFDVIVSTPPGSVNRMDVVVSETVEDGVGSNDNIRLGFSIVDGLGEHLSPDGAAVLYYGTAVLHDLMVGYATHRGFDVTHHPAHFLTRNGWFAMYNAFAAWVAETERLDPSALLVAVPRMPVGVSGPGISEPFSPGTAEPETSGRGGLRPSVVPESRSRLRNPGPLAPHDFLEVIGPGSFTVSEYCGNRGHGFPRLWNAAAHQVIPGMIVIRKPSPAP